MMGLKKLFVMLFLVGLLLFTAIPSSAQNYRHRRHKSHKLLKHVGIGAAIGAGAGGIIGGRKGALIGAGAGAGAGYVYHRRHTRHVVARRYRRHRR